MKSRGLQLKPNLNGTWKFDQALTRRAKSKQLRQTDRDTTLVILQGDSEIRMTSKTVAEGHERTREFVFYGDGRGEKNPGPTISLDLNDVSAHIKSKTKWKKNKLITTSTVRRVFQGVFYNVEVFDKWELSPDGQTLTLTTSLNSDKVMPSVPLVIIPFGGEIKNVYRRIAD